MSVLKQGDWDAMAQELAIPGAGTTAKIRNPLGVLALGLITLGIYHVFWWYFINREMADLGRANRRPELGDNPIMSVVAVTIGALIIVPLFVSFWRTLKRIETSQNLVLGSNNLAVVLVFILGLIPLVNLIVAPLMQSNLNQVWEAGGQPAGSLESASAQQPIEQAESPPASPPTPTA
jgi:heme/copper-type cytochrome/quinol oxidase subunit 2